MPLPFDVKHLLGGKKKNDDNTSSASTISKTSHPFNFEDGSYRYPNMAEEAHEMLQVSMLIYSITDLRSLARHPKKSQSIQQPERILNLPLSLTTCLELLEENYDVVKQEFGDDEHANTISSLQGIHARYHRQRHEKQQNGSAASFVSQWLNPLLSGSGSDQGIEVQANMSSSSSTTTTSPVPVLTAYGDENPETDMVYAVGVDPTRKRITVAFRGSVTSTDFLKDASINMKHQPNPIKTTNLDPNHEYDTIGIHQGFFDYLLKERETKSKLEEIVEHVTALFEENPERQSTYKLYVTGHSLGGALATLFSLYVASSVGAEKSKSVIPSPVSCISVASPRVGDRNFQAVFAYLEEHGLLRHLRIANDRDPVTVMPGATGKKIWAALSPVSYVAFKLMDREFEEKEKFRHTGVKLLLAKDECEFFYAGNPLDVMDDDQKVSQDNDDSSSAASSTKRSTIRSRSTRKEKIPDVVFHLGKAYTDNMASVAEELSNRSLNDLYRIQVAATVAKKGMVEEGEQS